MEIPLVDLKQQYQNLKEEIDKEVLQVMENAHFILGEKTKVFERNFSKFLQKDLQKTVYCLGCANGTDALVLALKALGIGKGDEIILPSHTFFACAEAILLVGASPKFVDVDEKTMLIDPEKIEKGITSKTKGIMVVHLYGHPCNMDQMLYIKKKYGLYLIEDSAQAHGAMWKSQRVGTFGDIACFSFFPGKNLGAYGDAGAIVSTNPTHIERARLLSNHGRKEKYEHLEIGESSRLDTLQAAILNVKLRYLDEWNKKRNQIAQTYLKNLSEMDVRLPYIQPNSYPVWHQFVIRIANRNACFDSLKKKGIEVGIHYPIPCHLQPALQKMHPKKELANTEKVCQEILSLPIYPELTQDKLKVVIENVQRVLQEYLYATT